MRQGVHSSATRERLPQRREARSHPRIDTPPIKVMRFDPLKSTPPGKDLQNPSERRSAGIERILTRSGGARRE